jgi:hypothetical protein
VTSLIRDLLARIFGKLKSSSSQSSGPAAMPPMQVEVYSDSASEAGDDGGRKNKSDEREYENEAEVEGNEDESIVDAEDGGDRHNAKEM